MNLQEMTESAFEVKTLVDFLSNQAGMMDLCFQITGFFLGNFLAFSQLSKYLGYQQIEALEQ